VSVLFLHYCNDHRLDDSSRKMTQTLDDMDESFHFIICKLKKMVTVMFKLCDRRMVVV